MFGYQGSEKDDEITGVTGAHVTTFFRELDTRIGRWWSPDNEKPNASESPYVSMGNNPIMQNDVKGDTTDYVNRKGELLYKTKDNLKDIIVIDDKNIDKFKAKLNNVNARGKLTSYTINRSELHPLGTKIEKLKEEGSTGENNHDVGYGQGYGEGYAGEKDGLLYWASSIVQSFYQEGAQIQAGRKSGRDEGRSDKQKGYMNKFNPYQFLKQNEPLIQLSNSNKSSNASNYIKGTEGSDFAKP